MNGTRFWSLIDRIGPDLNPLRLGMVLSTLNCTEVLAFRLRVNEMASALGGKFHRLYGLSACEHDLSRSGVSIEHPAAPNLAEFDELTMTVVAMGHDRSATLAVPHLLAGS